MSQPKYAMIGMAVMGSNFAQNFAEKGFDIAIYNRTASRTKEVYEGLKHQPYASRIHPVYGPIEDLVKTVGTEGTYFIMVKAGGPTQAVIDQLRPLLSPGALVVDLANSHYDESNRRVKAFEGTGIHFFGVGVSGGEEGARHGPSIMPGGASQEVYDARLKTVLEAVSAKAPQDGLPCVTFVGKGAAGHYVKMVHNGIEYGDMQVIAEAYDIMRNALGLSSLETAEVFAKWKTGILDSFLIDITVEVLRQADPSGKGQLVDYIVDVAQMKGTGTWTVASSLELKSGVMPIPGIYSAVESRAISAKKDLRVKISKAIQLPKSSRKLDKEEVINHLEKALYVAKIASYAQGLQLIEEAAKEYGFGHIDLARVAEIWRAGCIIRARFLGDITNAYRATQNPEHLLLAFSQTVVNHFPSLKYICGIATEFNVPTVAFDMARNYIIQYSSETLPLNLTQIQRDYFGAHTYQRTDKKGSYHTNWSSDRKEIESDFGLARRIYNNKLAPLEYGMPEFAAPETINGHGVGHPADMWSVGVITYIFLSGISPFRGETDRDTLRRVQAGQINFDPEAFSNISSDAKDFVAKLLVFKSEGRLTVNEALKHPWLRAADRYHMDDPSAYQIPTERLKTYYDRYYRDWYSNASCRTWYRYRPLGGAFTHPSNMVYPPGEIYTPRASVAPERRPSKNYQNEFKTFEHPGSEGGVATSESHYQYGPDTYLLQLRDVDFPVRLRQYMKVAATRSFSYNMRSSELNFEPDIPIVHERRRFTDIMDEEIDDESRRARRQFTSNPVNANSGDTGPLQYYVYHANRRLKHELGLRDEAHTEADAILEAKRRGLAPFLREKPQTVAMVENKPVQFSCLAVGDPAPSVQWFKNDVVLLPDRRITITHDPETGASVLKFNPALIFDCGIYKVVARNKTGQTVAKARLVMGDIPSAPDSPECTDVSDKEILLRWKVPRHDGNSPVLCYSLQMKLAADPPTPENWKDVADNIDHEFFLIRDLETGKEYQFRLAARNRFGWSERSIPTDPVATKEPGSPRVSVTRAMKYLQQLTESGQPIEIPLSSPDQEPSPPINYVDIESNPKETKTDAVPTEDYTFIAEVARGRFSMVAKCADKKDPNSKMYAAKIVVDDELSQQELKIHKTLCHERIVAFHQAYESGDLLVTIMEKLQGVDVLTCLSQRHEYTENMVAHIITQVLDGLQYLHWRGIGHLDLQPDNVLLTSARSIDVKLCDFGCAQRVSKLGTSLDPDVKKRNYLPFTSPEVLNDEPVFPQTDVWSLGALTYVLLSGVSPFTGESDDETRQNITYVRFRFEHLYKEISMEATRFIMLVFKRAPNKRPSTEECLEHRWFQPSEHMLKKRERASFLGNRLKNYSEEYHQQRMKQSTKNDQVLSSFGLGLGRSISNQTDIFTTF